jgi:hypothetical protein
MRAGARVLGEREGMDGISPRYVQDKISNALVAEDGREQPFRISARERELVGVADAGGLDLDQHLAGLGAFQLHRLDAQGVSRPMGNCRANVHAFLLFLDLTAPA